VGNRDRVRVLRNVAVLLFLCLTADAVLAASPLEIVSVNARLFLGHTGTLSAPLTHGDVLRNTIIGEGTAGEPSQATLVDVIVKGTPGEFDPHWKVDLIVTNSATGAVQSRFSQRPGVLSATGDYHVAFWLADTGCIPLRIVAKVHGTSQSKEAIVAFQCAE
jgi:hypothetical protein